MGSNISYKTLWTTQPYYYFSCWPQWLCTIVNNLPWWLFSLEFQLTYLLSTLRTNQTHNGLWALGFLAVSPQVTIVTINPVVGCLYFPPDLRSLSQPKRSPPSWPVLNYTAWRQRDTGVSSLPKATMQWSPARTRIYPQMVTANY